jgi:hypothetical protein
MNAIFDNSKKQVFIENVKKMSDEQVLTAIKNSADYDPYFIELAKEEIALRGYDFSNSDLQSIDSLIIKHKSTDELIKIYVNSFDYKKEWNPLAENELKDRNFDINSLYAEKENGERILKEGIEGSHIFLGYILAVLGGIIGLIVLLNYMNKKILLTNGDKVYKYNESTRSHGKTMLICWIVANVLGFVLLTM